MFYLVFFGTIVVGYFLGNINAALIISKIKKSDIRKAGSGNPGTMNMVRNFGKRMGAITLFLDALKGAIAAVLGWFLIGSMFGTTDTLAIDGGFFQFSSNKVGMLIGGVAAIMGHIYPIFLKFKGGKGIATTIGVCMVLNPIITAIAIGLGVGFIMLTKMGAITSFVIITPPLVLTGYFAATGGGANHIIIPAITTFIFLITMFKHRSNIKKLFLGVENKTVLRKKKK